jgi:hypothetical protein
MALRAGVPDAVTAHAHQCFVCAAVEGAAEYDSSEPVEVRSRAIAQAVTWFHDRFGRAPLSLVAPDYRWDERLERDAGALGLTTFQGRAEQAGRRFGRLRHAFARRRWQRRERGANPAHFDLPARIAFEPRGAVSPGSRLGSAAAHRAVRAAWAQDQPAIVSSHRLNYAHLDPAWSAAGRRALADLLRLLTRDGAVFLTDAEVRSLDEHGWSLRPLGPMAALLRCHGPVRSRVTIPAPAGATGGQAREPVSGRAVPLALEPGGAAGDFEPGDYQVEWTVA